ncbi:uncharacterized protein CMU_018140 [Cryptosporidium muris RN66]|uniref:Uncharacterized protein n=1 Tax=Cryptosporidium muris (strain RN66) TaxID=441375 RepID=B6AD53_CRYMR|nr:uncharacterized protein CMU_018140 [Cryptosporidium muris RN66]EEA06057.1 hypothetical protein, conserved [Cryptosporidium muris RN66]|eukprot:XP_002140406.1 hypothetical protein [Cryptosporidium muris RN66]
MDRRDVDATVKTAFGNNQMAMAFAAAVEASSENKVDNENSSTELNKVKKEVEELKQTLNEIKSQLHDIKNKGNEQLGSSKTLDQAEWISLQQYIYEHFKNQAEIQRKFNELEENLSTNGNNVSELRIKIREYESSLEVNTNHITTLALVLDEWQEKVNRLDSVISNLKQSLDTNAKIVDNIAKLPNSILDIFYSQSQAWNGFSKVLNQLSNDMDKEINKSSIYQEENNNLEVAISIKTLVEAMKNLQPLLLLPNIVH